MVKNSATGIRTRVARVRAEYPNQLDYSGSEHCHTSVLQTEGPGFNPQWVFFVNLFKIGTQVIFETEWGNLRRQFARVVGRMALRSTGGNCAWARTPQLTCFGDGVKEKSLSGNDIAKKALAIMAVWPSVLRRCLKAPFRKGVGSNPTTVTFFFACLTSDS